MNKKAKYWIAGIAAVIILGLLSWSCQNNMAMNRRGHTSHTGQAASDSGKKSSSADKELAQDIITVQKEEIHQMNSMIDDLEASKAKDPGKAQLYLDEYEKMMDSSHSHHVDTTDIHSVDQAFAQGMILHHQMAVDMADLILPYADSPEITELAKNIIRIQKEEISQMENLSNSL